MSRFLIVFAGLVLVTATTGSAAAEDCPAGTTMLTFDHSAKSDMLSSSIRLTDGKQFVIRVVNTVADDFTYVVTGATAVSQTPSQSRITAGADTTMHDECVTHQKQFGGYMMRVEKKADAASTLPNKTILVFVDTDDWNYEVAGAFTVSGLQDPIWSLQSQGGGSYKIVGFVDTATDKKSDPVRLGVASFITAYHSAYPHLGITFGIGIDEGKRPTYYPGLTLRMGKAAGLTGGVALGAVRRLPNSLSEGATVTDVNALSDLPTRTAVSWFFGFSYSFLGSADKLKPPFAGQ